MKDIDKNLEWEKRKKIIYTIGSLILILVIILFGVSYAWYSFTNTDIDVSGTTSSWCSGLDVKVSEGSTISNYLGNAPVSNYSDAGYSSSFTITNNESTEVKVDLSLIDIDIDTELISSDFRYTIVKDSIVISEGNFSNVKEGSGSSLTLGSEITIPQNSTNTYSLILWIYETGSSQSEMMNKSLSAKIKVSISSSFCSGSGANTGVATLISKANSSSVTNYSDGDTGEMYTFTHEETEQTSALTDYRYIGNSPNNYITFNDEIWRIIGVFSVDDGTGNYEQRIKIIRDESLGDYMFDGREDFEDDDFGYIFLNGYSAWSESQLMMMLNPSEYVKSGYTITDNVVYSGSWSLYQNMGAYYNAGSGCEPASIALNSNFSCISVDFTNIGLNATARSQIAESKWYLGGNEYDSTNHLGDGSNMYTKERGTTVYSSSRGISWTGLIGLMYPSDYVYTYADGVDSTCYSDAYNCSSSTPSSGWLFNSSNQWTISPDDYENVFNVITSGTLTYSFTTYTYDVRPVLFLKSDIQLTGTGMSSDPYQIVVG